MYSVLIVLASSRRRGAEIEGLALAGELRRLGRAVSVVALTGDGMGDGLAVEVLGPSARSPRTLIRLRRRSAEVDIVIAYGSSTLAACAIALAGTKTPFVYRSIGDPARWVRGDLHRWRTGMMLRRAEHVVALWSGGADSIRELYGLLPAQVSVIPNARHAPTDRQRSHELDELRTRWGIDERRPVLMCVGALVPEKALPLAIDASAALPEVQLIIVGDGPERGDIERRAEAVDPSRVKLVGAVNDAPFVLGLADLLLVPSRTEGMPGAIIEAGLAGVPTVASSVGAVPELVDHQRTGYLVPPGSLEDLVEGIRVALDERSAWGPAARRRMLERFTWDSVLPAWDELIGRLAVPRRHDRRPHEC